MASRQAARSVTGLNPAAAVDGRQRRVAAGSHAALESRASNILHEMLTHHLLPRPWEWNRHRIGLYFPAPTAVTCLKPLVLSRCAAATPLGLGCEATLAALRESRSGLRPNDFETARLDTWIGRVDGLEAQPVTGPLAEFDCRNNRLAQLGLRQDGFEDAVAQAREPLRRAAHRGPDRHQHFRHSRDRACLPPARPRERRAARRTTAIAIQQNVFSVADFVRRYLRSAAARRRPSPRRARRAPRFSRAPIG